MAKKSAKTTAKPSKSAKAAKPKAPTKKAVVKKVAPKASAKPVKKPAPAPKKAATAPKKSAASAKHPTVKGKPQSPDVKSKKKEPAKPAASASKPSSSKTTKAAKTPTPAAKPAPAPAPAPVAKNNGSKTTVKAGSSSKSSAPAPQYSPLPKVIKQSPLEASADLVLKPAYNPKKLPPFFKKQHQRLIELRSVLSDLMEGMAKETLRSRPEGSDASVGGMHMGDAGSDAYDRDFALSMLTKEQDALYEINEALERMDRGVYGLCELSGKKIPEERLEALPYTRYTREMQEQIERDQMGGKFRRPIVRSVFGLDDEGEGDEDDEEGETKESSPTESSLDFMKE
jgi:RNA polymerase-binding transcription factor DksA